MWYRTSEKFIHLINMWNAIDHLDLDKLNSYTWSCMANIQNVPYEGKKRVFSPQLFWVEDIWQDFVLTRREENWIRKQTVIWVVQSLLGISPNYPTIESPTEISVLKLHCGYCRCQVLTRKKSGWNKKMYLVLLHRFWSVFKLSRVSLTCFKRAVVNQWKTTLHVTCTSMATAN